MTQQVSIENQSAFAKLQQCVQECVFGFPYGGDNGVNQALDCGWPVLNNCYCATSATSTASSFLTSCVDNSCSRGDLPQAVTVAVSFYDSYCVEAGYAVAGAPTTAVASATTTAITGAETSVAMSPGSTGASPPAETSSTSPAASSSTSNNNSGSSGGLSTSDKIALGVGIGVGAPATIATIIMCVFQLRGR